MEDVTFGINAVSDQVDTRALTTPYKAIDVHSGVLFHCKTLPSNLKYSIVIYETKEASIESYYATTDWFTSGNTTYDSSVYQQSYAYFRVLFGSVNNNRLTEADFTGLEFEVYQKDAHYTPDVGITPSKPPYHKMHPFRFWAQKVLPTVYDDSLSYYEVLTKLTHFINECIAELDNLNTGVENTNIAFDDLQVYVNHTKNSLLETYDELQGFVNNYFDNVDTQAEIDRKLDEMADSGALSSVLSPFIPDLVTAWLNANVDPVGSAVTVDKSLTIYGSAGDSGVIGDRFDEISEVTNNEFSVEDIIYHTNARGDTYFDYRAVTPPFYSEDGIKGLAFTCTNIPSNIHWEVAIYSSADFSSFYAGTGGWRTVDTLLTSTFVQDSYRYFRIVFGTVDDSTLTAEDLVGLKMQVVQGNNALPFRDHYTAKDIVARNLVENVDNISEATYNEFNIDDVVYGMNATGGTSANRGITLPFYANDAQAGLYFKCYNIPANIKWDVEIYSSDNIATRYAGSSWITLGDYRTNEHVTTYRYFRILFGTVDDTQLTPEKLKGIKIQVVQGAVERPYVDHFTAVDSVARSLLTTPVNLRIMEYNIGHYCWGLGSSFDDIGLTPENYDEYLQKMKQFFAKTQPDILGLCEYWTWLDRAKTHAADSTLFDQFMQYKNQSEGWNALKSHYELSNNSQISLGGTGQTAMKSEVHIAGQTVGILLVHFGLTAESRSTEMTNAVSAMSGYSNAIIMGDFNTDTIADRNAVYGIAQTAGYSLANGGYFGWHNTWSYDNPRMAIDNILTKGRIKVKDYQVLTEYGSVLCSDHFPTYADVTVY